MAASENLFALELNETEAFVLLVDFSNILRAFLKCIWYEIYFNVKVFLFTELFKILVYAH